MGLTRGTCLFYDDHMAIISSGSNGFVGRAELELDLRLADVMVEALGLRGRWTKTEVAAYLRLAYASGYEDALKENARGQLFRELGLPVPERRL
jgi:hypothetical protein